MVWKVPWLPCAENGFLTSDMPPELQNIKVQGLMVSGEHRWDEEVIDDICNARDAELIKRIPLSLNGRQDSWCWILESTGLFTVKSCYRRIQGEHNTLYSSFWKKLWSLKMPGKIANFLWRVCSACIPTAVALLTKRVQIDVKCPWCRLDDEDEIHVLFTCSFAKSVWDMTAAHDLIQVLPGEKCFDVLQRCFATGTTDQLVLIALICWNLWNRRNKWVWDKINMSVFGVKEGAMNLLYDWRKAQQEVRKSGSAVNTNRRKWSKPEQGWLKVNVDAARFEEGNSIGLGAVIRNDQGEFVRARSRRLGVLLHPREAEAISLREALSWVKDLGYKNCVFETDAKQLAEACNGIHGESYFHTIALDCVDFYKHFENVLVRFVHRSANVVAHKLARATSSMSDVQEWIFTPPEFVFQDLVFDSI